MSETSSICDRRCSNNAIVRKVSNRDLFYHGEWELPDDTIKVTFPAGYDAECMLNNIRIALNAMDEHNAIRSVDTFFNGRASYVSEDNEEVELPVVLRVFGNCVIALEIDVSDEANSQTITYEIVGAHHTALAKSFNDFAAIIKGGEGAPWLQRDITCMLRRPFDKDGKMYIPVTVYVTVSAWEACGEYICTPYPPTVVTEGYVIVTYSEDSFNFVRLAVPNEDISYLGEVVLPAGSADAVVKYSADVLASKLFACCASRLSQYGSEVVQRLQQAVPDRHNAMDEVVINVSSENVGEYHGKESNTTQDGQKDK